MGPNTSRIDYEILLSGPSPLLLPLHKDPQATVSKMKALQILLIASCFIIPTFGLLLPSPATNTSSRHSRSSRDGARQSVDSTLVSKRGLVPDDTLAGSSPDTSDESSGNDGTPKYVFAHFIVGNTYPYGESDWAVDMQLARKAGIDGFALNVGGDYWQATKVADAFKAALTFTPVFKLFFSFDLTSLPCSGTGDANAIRSYISGYNKHPAQLVDNSNRMVVSTFGGEFCTFGQGSLNAGWEFAVKQGMPATSFIPGFFTDPSNYKGYPVMDGDFYWDGGWPLDDSEISFDRDQQQIDGVNELGPGKVYMAPVSPWFFTHYGVNSYNKNFIYKADNHLYASRWEILIANRNKIAIAQIVTWNDYGESHYVGRIAGDQPNSQAWTNGFDHTGAFRAKGYWTEGLYNFFLTGWLEATKYYAEAFRTGVYPHIVEDRIILSGRPHAKDATANDSVGRPTNWQWTDDFLWAVVFSTAPCVITLSSGLNHMSFNVIEGISKLQLAQSPGGVSATMSRAGREVYSFSPAGFSFTLNPPSYNFNAYVAAGP
ncbi:hypothetical protein FRB97_005750 [Tulasnella sp. 331]|nr:hypothetical protein FRB97_005750 [Tulasnella sp. 331]